MCLSIPINGGLAMKASIFGVLPLTSAMLLATTVVAQDDIVADLPPVHDQFKVDPYIAAAGKLQEMGKAKAVATLRAAAVSPKDRQRDMKVIVLCRMLFTARPDGKFRRPEIGGGMEIVARETWPLEPIEIVDGVPFL